MPEQGPRQALNTCRAGNRAGGKAFSISGEKHTCAKNKLVMGKGTAITGGS